MRSPTAQSARGATRGLGRCVDLGDARPMRSVFTTSTILAIAILLALACGPQRQPFNPNSTGATYTDPPDVHLVGDQITIDDHILFAHDSDEILAESSGLLDRISEFLQHHEEIASLTLVGHTDATGDATHNMDLSTRRAAAVRAALEQRGVTQPIDSRGAGMTEPLCEEDSEECNRRNRRVEFQVQRADG